MGHEGRSKDYRENSRLYKNKGKLIVDEEDKPKEKVQENEFAIMKKPKVVSKYITKIEEEKKMIEAEKRRKA